jgi:hypothetical protein
MFGPSVIDLADLNGLIDPTQSPNQRPELDGLTALLP